MERINNIEKENNKLFAFSGIDGCGKTTLINNVSKELKNLELNNYIVKAYSNEFKTMFKDKIPFYDDTTLRHLFNFFSSLQSDQAIKYLKEGNIVLADRWSEAFEQYHSMNGEISKDYSYRQKMINDVFRNLKPHLTFYVSINFDYKSTMVIKVVFIVIMR